MTAATLNPAGHSMTDGQTIATDLDKTATNKATLSAYMNDLIAGRQAKLLSSYDTAHYIEHDPQLGNALGGVAAGQPAFARQPQGAKYTKVGLLLGEGSFVFVGSEGVQGGQPYGFFDLYRVQNGKITEHWDTAEAIPPRNERKNQNGKF